MQFYFLSIRYVQICHIPLLKHFLCWLPGTSVTVNAQRCTGHPQIMHVGSCVIPYCSYMKPVERGSLILCQKWGKMELYGMGNKEPGSSWVLFMEYFLAHCVVLASSSRLQFSQFLQLFAPGETLIIPLSSVGTRQNKCFCAWVLPPATKGSGVYVLCMSCTQNRRKWRCMKNGREYLGFSLLFASFVRRWKLMRCN